MVCPKCASTNTSVQVNTVVKSKSRSILWNLLMLFITGGLWIIWMIIRKKKERIVNIKPCTCQNCGYSWNLKY